VLFRSQVVAEIPFFAGMEPAHIELIAGCAKNVRFQPGETLFREGKPADAFYLVRRGSVTLETFVPARGAVKIETVEPGEIVGWSWLFPPYVWHFDARAVDDVRAVAFDGACLRGKCEADHDLGYDLMRRFAAVMIDRLLHTRLRLLDLYGHDGTS
jgi:CRP/FNR family cyclic AMP-dependent transcriptional regulator